jgi:hypothetical protein
MVAEALPHDMAAAVNLPFMAVAQQLCHGGSAVKDI